jgi:biopolymer transport protein ExbB
VSFIQGTLLGYFNKGGPVMWPLLFCAILALAFIIERWWVLWRSKIKTDEFLNRLRAALLKRKSAKEAIAVCEEYQGPIANILKAGLVKYGTSEEEIEKAIEIAVNHELARLERGLAVLGTIANIGPLLGFLGTVTGMIKSFGVLAEQGLKNPEKVAEGISEALITTATGLAIAIPASLFYNYFSTKISRFVLEMETGSNMLLETFAAMESGGSSD